MDFTIKPVITLFEQRTGPRDRTWSFVINHSSHSVSGFASRGAALQAAVERIGHTPFVIDGETATTTHRVHAGCYEVTGNGLTFRVYRMENGQWTFVNAADDNEDSGGWFRTLAIAKEECIEYMATRHWVDGLGWCA